MANCERADVYAMLAHFAKTGATTPTHPHVDRETGRVTDHLGPPCKSLPRPQPLHEKAKRRAAVKRGEEFGGGCRRGPWGAEG